MVGTSGSALKRFEPSTASNFSFPDRTNGSCDVMAEKVMDMVPLMRSLIACPAPL